MSFYDNFATMITAMLLGLFSLLLGTGIGSIFFLIGMYYALRTFLVADRRK